MYQVNQWGWLAETQNQSRVESIQAGILLVKPSAGETLRVQLLGLTFDKNWRPQAEGAISMLLNSAQAKVNLSHTQSTHDDLIAAIVTLPNGTSLQEILLADGLAKLDLSALKTVPCKPHPQVTRGRISC
jgi:hypothetical protein